MLPPTIIPLIARHLDAIDEAVARSVTPNWQETGLTSLLCDLLDSRTQGRYNLAYTLGDLAADIAAAEPMLDFELSVSSIQYSAGVERYVTQADLGLVVEYDDLISPQHSRRRSWLLQAKRAYPGRSGAVDDTSQFKATRSDQNARIEALRNYLGHDFVRYLLYAPRATGLSPQAAAILRHARQTALSDIIFDFTLGQAWYVAARTGDTFDSGVLVETDLPTTANLTDAHAALFRGSWPLTWFIIASLVDGLGAPDPRRFHGALNEDERYGVATGQAAAVARVLEATGGTDRPLPFLPARTLRVRLIAGRKLDEALADQQS